MCMTTAGRYKFAIVKLITAPIFFIIEEMQSSREAWTVSSFSVQGVHCGYNKNFEKELAMTDVEKTQTV